MISSAQSVAISRAIAWICLHVKIWYAGAASDRSLTCHLLLIPLMCAHHIMVALLRAIIVPGRVVAHARLHGLADFVCMSTMQTDERRLQAPFEAYLAVAVAHGTAVGQCGMSLCVGGGGRRRQAADGGGSGKRTWHALSRCL